MEYKGLNVNIRDVQKIQLEILLKLDEICRKNEIKYQLFAGTLLGAVRHKGFIPWDDDIDVCLLREDYEKFIQCCKKELNEEYFLQTYETDKNTYLQFAKLRKNNTLFTSFIEKDTEMHKGIYIDIFPLDNVKPESLTGKIQLFLFNLLYVFSSSSIKERALNTQSKFNKVIRLMMYYMFKLIPKYKVYSLTTKVARMFDKENTNYISHLTNGVTKVRFNKYLRVKEDFNEIIYSEFENHLFPIPKNYHDVLTRNFGDYMKLPSEDKRYPHHGIIEIKFDTK